jgi:uncharacterized protein with gpF-like domain
MAVVILNKKPKKQPKRYKEINPIDEPKSAEWEARRTLTNMIDPMAKEVEQILEEMRDSSPNEIGQALDGVRKQYEFNFEQAADLVARNWVDRVNDLNRRRTMESLRKALGIDVAGIISEDMTKDLDIMRYEAAHLIKTIPQEYMFRVADRVLQAYKGLPMPENRTLQAQIKEEFKVSKGRAKVIARDQTSKMNTSMSAIRQQNIGITMYIWRTVKDRRVVGTPGGMYKYNPKNQMHKNHYIMEGVLCRWDDSTVYSRDNGQTWIPRSAEMPKNHPGTDIMCRCHAAPFIDIKTFKANWTVGNY